jgi:hypothetical protein
MNRIVLCAALLAPAMAIAQGNYVVFQNVVLTPPPDRLVRFADGTPLVGTQFMAQLLVGTSPDSLQPTTVAPSRFRDPATQVPGTWSGGTINLPAFTPGMILTMQVRIWDSTYGNFDEACMVNQASLLPTFDWVVPNETDPIEAHYMLGFMGGIPTPCPEPATIGLAALGVAVLLLVQRRRKDSLAA